MRMNESWEQSEKFTHNSIKSHPSHTILYFSILDLSFNFGSSSHVYVYPITCFILNETLQIMRRINRKDCAELGANDRKCEKKNVVNKRRKQSVTVARTNAEWEMWRERKIPLFTSLMREFHKWKNMRILFEYWVRAYRFINCFIANK